MADKVLTIDTVLGEAKHKNLTDPLMLTELTGQEGISVPFVYDVTMARDPDLHDVVPADMIGTMARIGIKQTDSTVYIYRTGMIQNFYKIAKYTKAGGVGDTDLLMFKARIIPAFQMLAQETRFRVFAQYDVVSLIQRIFKEMNGRASAFRFNIDRLKPEDFPTMEYCVQFGESTFAFLMRLMNRFGIWFTFDHDKDADNLPLLMHAENETMVLGKFPAVPDKLCDIHTHTLTNDDPDRDNIASFQRQATPQLSKTWAGNFNILDPTRPVNASKEIHPSFDLLIEHSAIAGFSESEEFPGRFQNEPWADEVKPTAGGQGDRSAKDYTVTREQQEEVQVFSVSGGTKNASLLAGRRIDIRPKDNKFTGDEGEYLLKMVIFSAYEHSYLTSSLTDLCNFLFRDLLFAPFQTGQSSLDFTVGVVNAGLNNYLQNQQSSMWSSVIYGDDHPPSTSWFLPFFLGGITQAGITSALSLLVSDVQKVVRANDGQFSNTFVAIPRNPPKDLFRVPTPAPGPRPIAHGPHSALVIGPDGVDTKNHEIWADALGRVRIRFPWDPGPPKSEPGLPPPWTSQFPGRPYETGDNTCWVRVSEEWAGRRFGTQFLPRIGQEVLVNFIDGDPDRPVITGRLYNADSTKTNLPFPNKDEIDTPIHKLSDLYNTAHDKYRFTGIKTRSTPLPKGAKDRYHLMRLDDTTNQEQYLIRSQGRLDVTAFAHSFETTYGNRHVKVAAGKKNSGEQDTSAGAVSGREKSGDSFGGASLTTVAGEYDLHVGDAFYGQVAKNYELTVKGDTLLDLEKNLTAVVKNQASVNAGSIVLEAGKQITLKVGGSSIVITNGNIFIWGPPPTQIDTTPGGPEASASATLQNVADAAAAEPGDKPEVRDPDPSSASGSGGGGKRGTHKAEAQHAPPVSKAQAAHEREEQKLQLSFDPGGQSLDC